MGLFDWMLIGMGILIVSICFMGLLDGEDYHDDEDDAEQEQYIVKWKKDQRRRRK